MDIKRRVDKVEKKINIQGNDEKKEPLIILIKRFNLVCPGYNEQIRRAETEGHVSFHEGRKHIVIRVAGNCGEGCTRCREIEGH